MPNHHPAVTSARSTRAGVVRSLLAALILMAGLLGVGTAPASAHVLPTSSIQLAVQEDTINAAVKIPLDDLHAASGIEIGDETAETIAAHAKELTAYLLAHFAPTTDTGQPWTVTVGALTITDAGTTSTTGIYKELTTTFSLAPPAGSTVRSFNLGYDAVLHQVVTHTVLVSVATDWSAGVVVEAYSLGTIRLDTTTGTVPSLHVDLGQGSTTNGFLSMVGLGIQHIKDGTDHQLFLLTLLLPAPLLAARRRWAGPAPVRIAVRRIAGITLAFTIGHSITLALGTLGIPIPSAPIEALIAVSILIAAAHAIRPLFAGKEILVAGFFGLIHGLAFSETLRELDLTGTRLGLSLLGFNLGIELMQLAVVAAVLPPLIMLARTGSYRHLRVPAAVVAAIAATGWLAARLGFPNGIAGAADGLGSVSGFVALALWMAAAVVFLLQRRARRQTAT